MVSGTDRVITFLCPNELYLSFKKAIYSEGYFTLSDFFRETMRRTVKEYSAKGGLPAAAPRRR